jgi:glycosyltransferase involved in cell wall biosynthesis
VAAQPRGALAAPALDAPLVSVVVPVHDGERFLGQALESALAQDYERIEIVVVDDGSTDRSADVARSFPVTLVSQPNRGVAEARNAGVAASRGELIAFLDQDDVWVEHKLSRQVAALAARNELGFVLSQVQVVLERGAPHPDWLDESTLRGEGTFAIPSALMVRRSTFEQVGGFDPSYRIACDTDWLARAVDCGVAWDMLDEPLVRYRIHEGNGVHERGAMFRELAHVLRDSSRRKREARPLVSVVIPVRDNARFIGAAIESVLGGSYDNHEVIVVDNDSSDGSGDIARRYPVRYFHQRDLGQAGGRNTGIRAARGELIAFLDSDDTWTPDKLERQVGCFLACPDLSFVLAYFRAVLEPGTPRPGWMPSSWLTTGERGMLPGTLLARREAFDQVGLFDRDYDVSSDTDWFVRAKDLGLRYEILPDVLLNWRLHGSNTSYRRDEMKDDLLRTMRASVVRKRAVAAGPDAA